MTFDPALFTGLAQFGLPYQRMLENDPHPPRSVDRLLLEQMVRLCPETASFLYHSYSPIHSGYNPGSRPQLERCVREATSASDSVEETLGAIAVFTRDLGTLVDGQEPDAMRFGGTEEEIINRGSDWCPDVARVACALCQVAGLHARIVYLFNLEQAYSAHVSIEAYRANRWGAIDPSTALIYRHYDGRPASTWHLTQNPTLVEQHARDPSYYYTQVEQFRAAAIVNYPISRTAHFAYTSSPVNDYYRAILERSNEGWPGGLCWIHSELER